MDEQQNDSRPPEPETAGRDVKGRFTPGNRIGKGRPIGAKVEQLRRALIKSVGTDDIREIVSVLLTQAKNGDLAAVKIVFERTLGQPVQADLLQRLEELESTIQQQEAEE